MAYPGIYFGGGGGSTNSVEDRRQRERGSGGGSPLVRGSGGSCILVQEISFHMVKVFKFLVIYAYVTSCLGEKKIPLWGFIAGGEGFSRNN